MRILDQRKIPYRKYAYNNKNHSALEVARALDINADSLFKTLVTVGKPKNHYVFMVPGGEELDLKKAAKACGEKSVEMILQKDLLSLTGYVHGGCSPIGMRKQFPTFIDASAERFETICFSAGKIGQQVQLPLRDLQRVIPVTPANLVK